MERLCPDLAQIFELDRRIMTCHRSRETSENEDAAKPAAAPSVSPPDEPPRREPEREIEPPATKSTSEPETKKAAKRDAVPGKSKDCKLEYGGYSINVPCKALD